jgi:hypothetical protein
VIRHKYDIPPQCCTCDEEGVCDDCCCAFWCGCCTTAQVARMVRRSSMVDAVAATRSSSQATSTRFPRPAPSSTTARRRPATPLSRAPPHPPLPVLPAARRVTTSFPRVDRVARRPSSKQSNKTHDYTRNWSPEGHGSPNFNASMAAHFPTAWYSPTITVRGNDPSTAPLCKVCVSTMNPPPFAPQSFSTT